MFRGFGARRRDASFAVRACAVAVVVAAVTAGCAVHNPTDLAQRAPVLPSRVPTTLPDGTPAFNQRAAARVIAQLGYGDARPKGKPPGPLRAFVASCRGTAAPCLNIFFFYRGRYVGAAFPRPQPKLAVRQQDGRLIRATIPTPSGRFRHARYLWTGTDVIGLTPTGTVRLVRVPSHALTQ